MYLRSPDRLGDAGSHTHRRDSSCWRSSSPAPRSARRQRRPENAPANASAATGASTSAADQAPAATLPPNANPNSAATKYTFFTDSVVQRRSSHAPSTPSAPSPSTSATSSSTTVGRNITPQDTATHGKLTLLMLTRLEIQ